MKASAIALLFSVSASAQTICPDGTYVAGDCTLAPDGSYVGIQRDEPRFAHYHGPQIPRTVVFAATDDDPSEQYQARVECEAQELPQTLRWAKESLLRGLTNEERAELLELGIELPKPEYENYEAYGVPESEIRDLNRAAIESLILAFQQRVDLCVFGKTGGWEWVREHPEEFRKLMEEAM